jgi:hypothetical protein
VVALYDGGLARSSDSGASFSMLNNALRGGGRVRQGRAGRGLPDRLHLGRGRRRARRVPLDRSRRLWLRINDDQHQYGGPGDAQFVVGDMNTFGVVYMSTAGRGIVYGKPKT